MAVAAAFCASSALLPIWAFTASVLILNVFPSLLFASNVNFILPSSSEKLLSDDFETESISFNILSNYINLTCLSS